MGYRTPRMLGLAVLFIGFIQVIPGIAQYREYHLFGKVLDAQKNPIEGVELIIFDVASNRTYSTKTKKGGDFRFIGLPHGVYQVTFNKEGFAAKQDEWKFETPQDKMQKVEIPPVTMVSQAQAREIQGLKESEAGVKESADKIRAGEFDAAITILKGLLEKNPKDSNALFLTGMAYLKKQMYPEAIPAFTQVTELSPKFAAAFHQLGVCFQGQNEPEKALDAYQKALDLDAGNTDAYYNSGLILFKLARIDEALARFEGALKLRPEDPASLEMAGRCYINKADFGKAVEYLEKAKTGTTDPERAKFLDELIAKLKEQIKE
jgi:tetratricopeptide (TPR) repeat protein